jgi:ADP-ribose pyrophosphatase
VDETHICLIRNYRCAIGQTLIELPAGTREEGESAEATAARELTEETGFRAQSLRSIGDFYLAPGILDEHMTLFVASGLEPGIARREPGEQIENLIVSWSDALRMVRDRTICDAKTMLGLLLAAPRSAGRSPEDLNS